MATLSPRYGFTLPDPADNVSVTLLNNDFLAVDAALGSTPCTAGTLPSTPVNGQLAYLTDTHDLYVWDTTGAVGVWYPLTPVTVRLGTNQTAVSNTTPTPVTDLTITLQASSSYTVEGYIDYSSDTAADAVLGLSLPSGATIRWSRGGPGAAAAATAGVVETAVATSASLTLGGAGVGVAVAAHIRGVLTTGVSVGNVAATWCQSVSTASNTVLYAGSWLRIQRI